MNRTEINLLSMIESVTACMDDNQALISDKPAFATIITKLKTNTQEINVLKQKQAANTKVDTAIKHDTKDEMIATMLVVSAGVAAVAVETNDIRLSMASAGISESALNNMRDNDLPLKAKELHDAATSIIDKLSVWGVTQENLDYLNECRENYSKQSPTIRNIKAKSTRATSEIKEKLDESNLLLKNNLDKLMMPFKQISPTFYGEYQNTRKIVNIAATHPKPTDEQTTKESE